MIYGRLAALSMLAALLAGCDPCDNRLLDAIGPVECVRRCEVDDPPPDCSCAVDHAEMDADLGVRAAICPECAGPSPHPDCENARGGGAIDGGTGDGGPGPDHGDGGYPAGSVRDAGTDPTGCRTHADCGGQTPACRANGECVPCLTDRDCANRGGICDEQTFACVECLHDGHCDDPARPVCDAERYACVTCVSDAECTDAAASRCDAAAHTCKACASHADCAHLPGLPACSNGGCVQCTQQTEDDCAGQVCDPSTLTCTTRDRASASVCEPCEYDSDCPTGDLPLAQREYRCVPMHFAGAAHGNYCLKIFATGCTRPYATRLDDVASTSGAAEDDYCGIDQTVTTCEAVRAVGTSCTGGIDAECGAPALDDGLCRTVAGIANTCTLPCGSALDCPGNLSCDAPVSSFCH